MSEKSVSFSKTITQSSLSNPWQLSLRKFHAYLPCHDMEVILVDESEKEYVVKFLIKQHQLSRGWRIFAIEHGLLEGDELTFHVIDEGKFKVHITRASGFTENEFQTNVPASPGKGNNVTEEKTCFGNPVAKKYLVSCVEMLGRMLSQIKKRVHEEVVSKEKVYIKSRSTGTTGADHLSPNDDGHTRIVKEELPAVNVNDKTYIESGNDSTPLAGQSVEVAYSESAISFKSFEDFKIQVNGEALDSEIPQDVRMKYYQLCCGQKKLIHDRVEKGLNSKFAAAVILEIVRIADSTKAATISTSPHDLECMGRTLQSFEELGFAVRSLRAKIDTLTKFSSEHRSIEDSMNAMSEIERELTAFQEKKVKIDGLIENAMTQYGELVGDLGMKIDALKERREKTGFAFSRKQRDRHCKEYTPYMVN